MWGDASGMIEVFYVEVDRVPGNQGGNMLNKEAILLCLMAGSPKYRKLMFTARELVEMFAPGKERALTLCLQKLASKRQLNGKGDNVGKTPSERARWYGDTWSGLLKSNALHFARDLMENEVKPLVAQAEERGLEVTLTYSMEEGLQAEFHRPEVCAHDPLVLVTEPYEQLRSQSELDGAETTSEFEEAFPFEPELEVAPEFEPELDPDADAPVFEGFPEPEMPLVAATKTPWWKRLRWWDAALVLIALILISVALAQVFFPEKEANRKSPHVYDEAERYWQYQPSHLPDQ